MSDLLYYASVPVIVISVILFLINPTTNDKVFRKILISIAILLILGVMINLFIETNVSMSLFAKIILINIMSILVVVYNGIEKSLTKSIIWGILFVSVVVISGVI